MRVLEKILLSLVIISLIGVLISILFFYTKFIPRKDKFITLFMPSDCDESDKNIYRYSTCQMDQTITKKEKMNFTLDGNREENKQKIDMIRYEALKLKFAQDTSQSY